jgi:hypothetical protein
MARTTYHVTPFNGGWLVKRAGARGVDSFHRDKDAAITRARELADAAGSSQVKVHLESGRVETAYNCR